MQEKLDDKPFNTSMEVKNKVIPLSHLCKPPEIYGKSLSLDPLKLFRSLVLVSQRDMIIEDNLKYELTFVLLSLFESNTNFINKPNKASLAKDKLKNLTEKCDVDDESANVSIIGVG